MLENFKNSIELLNRRIKFNLDIIHQNEKIIQDILTEPITEERSLKLNKRFIFSRNLLQENSDAINLQKSLSTYLEKYHSKIAEFTAIIETSQLKTDSFEDIIEISKEDYLKLTINNEIEFDEKHPYFHDEQFLNNLLAHFSETENYEMCSKLINQSKDKNLSEK